MDRPAVSVIVPFAGDRAKAGRLGTALAALRLRPDDEVIVVDNTAASAARDLARDGWLTVLHAYAEASSYYARNTGAEHASNDWLLFLDSDVRPTPHLVDAFFAEWPGERVGALGGTVQSAGNQRGALVRFAQRYRVVAQEGVHEYLGRPYALTANLLVRASTWRDAGGFAERVRSGGDIDFCWRVQELGWELRGRTQAVAEHHHRERLAEFIRPPVRYGAGLAWLRRRWPDISVPHHEIGAIRGGLRGVPGELVRGRPDEAVLRGLLLVFNLAQAVGGLLSNLPPGRRGVRPASVVLCASRFPGDPEGLERVRAVEGHVEALGRSVRVGAREVRELDLAYVEDDGIDRRLVDGARLVARHPLRALRWSLRRRGPRLPLWVVAPAAERVRRTGAERVVALDPQAEPLAEALATLADTEPVREATVRPPP